MKCVYCGESLEGLEFSLMAAHKRRCASIRREYKPMKETVKDVVVSKAESKLAGFIISSHTAEMSGGATTAIAVPVEMQTPCQQLERVCKEDDMVGKLISMVDDILAQVDVLEHSLRAHSVVALARLEKAPIGDTRIIDGPIGPKVAQKEVFDKELQMMILVDK